MAGKHGYDGMNRLSSFTKGMPFSLHLKADSCDLKKPLCQREHQLRSQARGANCVSRFARAW
jgi:hypothetical protein